MTPVVLTIAGSDCSAGAGLQADMKAALALGCFPLTVLTCAVSEIPGKVEGIVPMEADFVASQLRLLLKSYPVTGIKCGMLYSPAIVSAVVRVLAEENYLGPLVVDPVMIATAGESLMMSQAIAVYEHELMPRTTVLTPNIDEACALLGWQGIADEAALTAAATQLAARYNCAVLAKGGHLAGNNCVDVLATACGQTHRWAHPRIENVTTHGTGCTLSAAIAALMASGQNLETATAGGLRYVEQAIAQTIRWDKVQALGFVDMR